MLGQPLPQSFVPSLTHQYGVRPGLLCQLVHGQGRAILLQETEEVQIDANPNGSQMDVLSHC
jgi:hypothetical protein